MVGPARVKGRSMLECVASASLVASSSATVATVAAESTTSSAGVGASARELAIRIEGRRRR